MNIFALLNENAGYGIDKMLMWEQKRGKVDFTDDVVSSTIIFYYERDDVRFSVSGAQDGTQEKSSQETPQKILDLVKEDAYITTQRMADLIGIDRSNVARAIKKLQLQGILRRVGPDKGGHWEIIPTDR